MFICSVTHHFTPLTKNSYLMTNGFAAVVVKKCSINSKVWKTAFFKRRKKKKAMIRILVFHLVLQPIMIMICSTFTMMSNSQCKKCNCMLYWQLIIFAILAFLRKLYLRKPIVFFIYPSSSTRSSMSTKCFCLFSSRSMMTCWKCHSFQDHAMAVYGKTQQVTGTSSPCLMRSNSTPTSTTRSTSKVDNIYH